MDARSITYISLEVVIGVASIIGNVLVLWAVAINRRLRTVTTFFIVSLAIADLMVGLIAIPCAIASYIGLPENNFYGCVFVNSIVILFTQSSVFSLLAIAIERFTAIKYPYAYETYFTKLNAIKIIVATWILSILIGLVPMMGWNLYPPTGTKCSFTDVIDMQFMVYFNFFLCILLPLLIMLGFYGYIFHIVRKQLRQIASLQLNHNKDRKQRQIIKEIKAAKSLAMILGFFAICWLPIHIMNSITLLCKEGCNQPYDLLLAAILLSHANSAFNPLLYAYCNTQFRLAFKDICLCRRLTSQSVNSRTDDIFTVTKPYSQDQLERNGITSSDDSQATKNQVSTNMNSNLSLAMADDKSNLNGSTTLKRASKSDDQASSATRLIAQFNQALDMDDENVGSSENEPSLAKDVQITQVG